MTTRLHGLKIWPDFYDAIDSGEKTFDVRRDDRGFDVGHQLLLREWDRGTGEYTARELLTRVTYILSAADCPDGGLKDGFVVLGIEVVER